MSLPFCKVKEISSQQWIWLKLSKSTQMTNKQPESTHIKNNAKSGQLKSLNHKNLTLILYWSFACTEVIVVKEVITPFGR